MRAVCPGWVSLNTDIGPDTDYILLPVGIPTGSPGLFTSRTREGHRAI